LALLEESGSQGLALQDLYELLAHDGVINNGSIRSVVWTHKKNGRVVAKGDRYYLAAQVPH